MKVPVLGRLGPGGRLVVVFLAGVLVTLLIVVTVVLIWRPSSPPSPTPAPPPSAPPAATASPSIDPDAGDYEHDHDTAGDEKPGWEPVVLGFGKNFTNTNGGAARWRARLAPFVVDAVRDQIAQVDMARVPGGRYGSYELLESGSYQIAAKVTYREGWAVVLYVTSDGHSWKVTAYDKWEQ